MPSSKMGTPVLVFLLVGFAVLTERAKPVFTESDQVYGYQQSGKVLVSSVTRESDFERLGVKPVSKICYMRVSCDGGTWLDNLIKVLEEDEEDFEDMDEDEDFEDSEDYDDIDEVDGDFEDYISEEQLQRYEELQKAPSPEDTTETTTLAAPSQEEREQKRKERKQKRKEERKKKKKEERKRKKEARKKNKGKKPKAKKPREITCFIQRDAVVKIPGNCSLWAPGVGTCDSGNMTDPYNRYCNPLPDHLLAPTEPLPEL